MYYLFASIIFTSLTYIVFKAFTRYGVNPLPAIVFNYFSRVSLSVITDHKGFVKYLTNAPSKLLILCTLCGLSFITVFSLVSRATRELGVTVTTIIARMSMVIPAVFSIITYHEHPGVIKVAGMLLAFAAIYFSAYEKRDKTNIEAGQAPDRKTGTLKILLPVLLFIGGGITDTLLKVAQNDYMPNHLDFVFIDIVYTVSGAAGIVALIVNKVPLKTVFRPVNLLWGFILGAINYIALVLFLLALTGGHLDGSQVFPINSVGIVLVSALLAFIIYKEKLRASKLIGLCMAVVSILLISLG